MIIRWALKLGLGALAPYALPALLAFLLGGGGLSAWWLEWTDYKTAILLVGALGLTAYLATVDSKWAKVIIALVIAGTCYLKGRIDENAQNENDRLMLVAKYEAQRAAIHKSYGDAAKVEQERQAKANQDALASADDKKSLWDQERQAMREELKRIQEEASRDEDAERTAFGLDAVDRINRLRHEPRSRGLPNYRRKARHRRTSILGSAAVPSVAGYTKSEAVPKQSRSRVDRRRETIRRLPRQARTARGIPAQAGCGTDWGCFWRKVAGN